MELYRKELGRVLKSLLYLLTTAGIILFAYTQGVFPSDETIIKPKEGVVAYGTKPSNDHALIMPEAAERLFAQYLVNQYTTYPNGFMKYIKLNQSDHAKMGEIIAELSLDGDASIAKNSENNSNTENYGIQINGDEWIQNGDNSIQIITQEDETPIDFQFNSDITWERFSELMEQADDLLGGGSDFSKTWISHRFGQVSITYEEALTDYGLIVSKDKLTGAHARLFSDYMGIILGLLPVFSAVFLCLRDRKNIASMLYTRCISSMRFISIRFLALITATMIPIFIMCIVLTYTHAMDYGLENIDMFAYIRYTIFWILPTAMASTAMGLFFTTLTNTPAAIAVQLVWWFVDSIGGSGAYSFFGIRPLQLIPRHNNLGKTGVYLDYLPNLIQNRIWIALIAVFLVCLTVFVFNIKRRGVLYVPIYKRSKIQSEV